MANQDITTPRRQAASFETLLVEKVRCLSDILKDIEHEVRHRHQLSKAVVHRIYVDYSYIKVKLFELYIFPIDGNRAIEGRRSTLESQLDALNQEHRREKVVCWQDVAQLRREWRTWFKQHSDLVQRVRLILPRPNDGRHSIHDRI